MENELVSIIIPCYNGEKYLARCFKGILNQTYTNIETIIVNDGSEDKTEEIIDKYISIFESHRMKLIKINQKNAGQAEAVNRALKIVKGKYLVWQDSDDYYEKDAIENMITFLQNNKNYDFVRGNAVFRNEEDIDTIVRYGKSKYPKESNIFNFYINEKDSYSFAGIFMINMSYFHKCIKNMTIYNSRAGQNWQLILPVAFKGKCGYIDKVVYNIVIRENSHSNSINSIDQSIERCNQLEDILLNVINNIDMTNAKLIKYTVTIKLRYMKKKLKFRLIKLIKVITKYCPVIKKIYKISK